MEVLASDSSDLMPDHEVILCTGETASAVSEFIDGSGSLNSFSDMLMAS